MITDVLCSVNLYIRFCVQRFQLSHVMDITLYKCYVLLLLSLLLFHQGGHFTGGTPPDGALITCRDDRPCHVIAQTEKPPGSAAWSVFVLSKLEQLEELFFKSSEKRTVFNQKEACPSAHVSAHRHTHIPHTHARTYAYTHTYRCMQTFKHTRGRTHTHTHARTHARTHTRTHTRTHARTHAHDIEANKYAVRH